jgi:hypothetical protein
MVETGAAGPQHSPPLWTGASCGTAPMTAAEELELGA